MIKTNRKHRKDHSRGIISSKHFFSCLKTTTYFWVKYMYLIWTYMYLISTWKYTVQVTQCNHLLTMGNAWGCTTPWRYSYCVRRLEVVWVPCIYIAIRLEVTRVLCIYIAIRLRVTCAPELQNIFSFLGTWEMGKICLRDEIIVYNSLYTIYNRSAALSVEKVHW